MNELRFHPFLNEWVAIATHRQNRDFLPPEDFCPLCPTKDKQKPTEIPEKNFEIVVFENKYPTFVLNAPEVIQENFLKKRRASGICEVVVYSPDHNLPLEKFPLKKIENLIEVWIDRYKELSEEKFIKYVLIFENKGREIGVTLDHPHGQIYAYPYIPPIVKKELNSALNYFKKNKKCLFCQILSHEENERKRVVIENKSFFGFIPFYARYPYEVHVFSKRHICSLREIDNFDKKNLASILKSLVNKYNNLFGFQMPYMMVIHQSPTDQRDYSKWVHFHIEFYPPYRTKDKLKFLASSEQGAGTFINDTLPEENAIILRNVKI
ncbi:MAG: galactose-1-phosphate uridylyltransferase [Acidobacteriota bacterium]